MYVFEEMVERIQQLKKEKNIKSIELATLSDVPIGTLGKILRMETKDPQVGSIIKIAQALGVSADFLVYGKESNSTVCSETEPLSIEEKQLVKNYRELNDEGRHLVTSQANALSVSGLYKKHDQFEVDEENPPSAI